MNPFNKRKCVVVDNIASLPRPDGQKKLYLWTFTFPDVIGYCEAMRRWNSLATVLRRHGFKNFVRVIERHPGGHGFHFHVVVAEWWNAAWMWATARACGFGRVDVRRRTAERCAYIAKYLMKEKRAALGKGARAFACCGKWEVKATLRDIKFSSDEISLNAAFLRRWGWANTQKVRGRLLWEFVVYGSDWVMTRYDLWEKFQHGELREIPSVIPY